MHGELDSLTHAATEIEEHLRRIEEQKAQAEAAKHSSSGTKTMTTTRGTATTGKQQTGDAKKIKSKDDTDIDTADKTSPQKNLGPRGGLQRNMSEAGLGIGRSSLGKSF